MHRWLRYLVIPGVVALGFGIWLMFARLGIGGVIAGAALFAAGVDMIFIGAAQPSHPRSA